eukprot:SAG11_NODE_200_length_12606_cov_51.874550_11_plen_34_part_00
MVLKMAGFLVAANSAPSDPQGHRFDFVLSLLDE